jgi:ATP-dependent Clp protease ATP-binding subunit ClpC
VKLIQRINQLGYQIEVSKAAKEFIAEKGFDSKYGARPLNRAIQKHLEDLVAENVVNNAIKEGDKILVDQNEDGEKLLLKINQELETS